MLVVGSQSTHVLGYTEIDELHEPVFRDHDICRVDIPMYVSLVMQSHQTGKDILDDENGKMLWVSFIVFI